MKVLSFISSIEKMIYEIGTDTSLQELGVKREGFSEITKNALNDICTETSRVMPTEDYYNIILTASYN